MPKGKVYVIDDDEAMRDSLDFLLGAAGFDVALFESAQAFLDALPSLGSAASSPTSACRASTASSCCGG